MLPGMPDVEPMLAQTWPKAFNGKEWLFELKWDGYRCLLYIAGSQVFLRSRNGKSLNQRFPQLEAVVKCVKAANFRNLIVDGEIVAFSEGRPDFSFLRTNPESGVYMAFDLLYLNDEFLLDVSLVDRRHKLSQIFDWNGPIYFSEAQDELGETLFEFVRRRDLEGMMAKRKHSLYFPGRRTRDWLKIKNFKEEDLWVVGYFPSPGRKIGSLLVAREATEQQRQGRPGMVHPHTRQEVVSCEAGERSTGAKRFVLLGRVSSGLNEALENALEAAFGAPIPHSIAQVQGKLPKRDLREVKWIEPFFGVKVQYTEITPEGRLRHPVLKQVIW